MPLLVTLLIVLAVLVIFAAAFLLVRTAMYAHLPAPVEPVEGEPVEAQSVAEHLAAAIRIETISSGDPADFRGESFDTLHRLLEKLYPRVHTSLQLEKINRYGLLYTWVGSNPELEPVLFAAHQDVVPADPSTLEHWTHPPFSGQIEDGFVWGRGALDIKSQMITLLEAVETLLKKGYRPERTIYLAFGQDEEVGGPQGATAIAKTLQERGVKLWALVDEGGALTEDVLPGVKTPIALIGTAEKGYLSLHFTVHATPGHSSAPPRETAIGLLARAIARLEVNPLPAWVGAAEPLFHAIAPVAPFSMQFIFANLWLFKGLAEKRLSASPQTSAMIRTTTAPTLISGGIKDNILPSKAEAVVNFRVLPGNSIAAICEYVRAVIGDKRVEFEPLEHIHWEASPVSPTSGDQYDSLSAAIRAFFPDVVVAPFLELGGTDARHYGSVCEHIYRFSPYRINQADLERIHGINERISVESLGQMTQFFIYLMRQWTGAE